MLSAERLSKIKKIIKDRGSVQVDELERELNVSSMTIRRDLIKLQEEGMIERCHGGAIAKQEIKYATKQIINKDTKIKLAKTCASLVLPGNTVFLDAGTTTYEIAKLIKDIPNLLVVTNDLEIAMLLKEHPIDLYICGGQIQKETGAIFGEYTNNLLADFYFDIGFFGTASINENLDITTPTIEKMVYKRNAIKQCKYSYLVADQSKFNQQNLVKVNNLCDYTGIITNYQFSTDQKDVLNKNNIEIYT